MLNFLLTASTEGASLLQVLQPGAQNQKATGLSFMADTREKGVALLMTGACTSSALLGAVCVVVATVSVLPVVAESAEGEVGELHAERASAAVIESGMKSLFNMV